MRHIVADFGTWSEASGCVRLRGAGGELHITAYSAKEGAEEEAKEGAEEGEGVGESGAGRAAQGVVRVADGGIYAVDYRPTDMRIPPNVVQASNQLFDPRAGAAPDGASPTDDADADGADADTNSHTSAPRLRRRLWDSVVEECDAQGRRLTLTLGEERLQIDLADGTLALYRRGLRLHGGAIGSRDTVLPRYPLRVYTRGAHAVGTFNFRLEDADRFYGCGDKGGSLNKRGRRLRMHNRDALGYPAASADPLYKSTPFFLKHNPRSGAMIGVYVPATDIAEIDFGVESRFFYSMTIRHGPFRYLLFTGDRYDAIIAGYLQVSGMPALPPLYSFGFFGCSMHYPR